MAPSVFPPQPRGLLDTLYVPDTWISGRGDDRYRRGLYTFFKRILPYPFYANFDAPSRETACVARNRSNTPLQALNLMNDQTFLEAARGTRQPHGLRDRARESPTGSPTDFVSVWAAGPPRRRLQELTALYRDQLENFS